MANGWTNASPIRKYVGDYNFTPTSSTQTIKEGAFFDQDLTLLGDSNLLPQNIRNGETIGGVLGRALEITDVTPESGVFYKNDNLYFPFGLIADTRYYNLSHIFKIGNNLISLMSYDNLICSTDGGATWTTRRTHDGTSYGDSNITMMVEQNDNSTIIVAASYYGTTLIYSTNGLSWDKCNYSGGQIKDICSGKNFYGLTWIVLDVDSKVYYSKDGVNFTYAYSLDSDIFYSRIVFFSGVFYIQNGDLLGNGTRYVSNDGVNWGSSIVVTNKFAGNLIGDPVYYGESSDRIYALGNTRSTIEGCTVKTTTDMKIWTDTGLSAFIKANEGYAAPVKWINSFALSNGSTVLVVGSDELPYMYYGTINNDASVTWSIANPVNEFNGVFLQNISTDLSKSQYLMIGYGGVYYNDNTANTIYNLVYPNNFHRASLDENYYSNMRWKINDWV